MQYHDRHFVVKFVNVTLRLITNPSRHVRISFPLLVCSSFSHLIISLCLQLPFRLLTFSVLQFLCPFLHDHLIFHTFAIYSFVRHFYHYYCLLMYLLMVPF